MSLDGQCNCGEIRVSVKQPPPEKSGIIVCRCLNCKKQGSGSGTYNLLVPSSDVTINGQTKVYIDKKTESGKDLERHFCGSCGSPVVSISEATMPGLSVVKVGLFVNTPEVITRPAAELYTRNRQEWEPEYEGAQQFLGTIG